MTANQIVAASANPNGFWVDVFMNGKSKGCVRVSCRLEDANQAARRLQSMKGSLSAAGADGVGYDGAGDGFLRFIGAGGVAGRGGGNGLLRKLGQLRRLPKVMESNLVGAGRTLKRRLPKHDGFGEGLRKLAQPSRKSSTACGASAEASRATSARAWGK